MVRFASVEEKGTAVSEAADTFAKEKHTEHTISIGYY
jgi:hypothetical protein